MGKNGEYKFNEKIQFVNPYNFVPANKVVSKEVDVTKKMDEELYTGYFVCNMEAKTPLAIPDTDEKKEDKKISGHYLYPAYRIDGQITIPGSSIRGVIRSVYEIITNSCMVTMKEDQIITKRSDIGTFAPGVLKRNKNNEWELYEAERIPVVCYGKDSNPSYRSIDGEYTRYEVKVNKGIKELIDEKKEQIHFGDEVKITDNGNGHEKKNNGKWRPVWDKSVSSIEKGEGTNYYLYLGERISNKHAESVFKISNTKPISSIKEVKEALKGLEETITMYRSESINRNLHGDHFGYRGYEEAKENGAIPIWYKIDNGKLYLSMAAIGRMAYHKSLGEISNSHTPCQSRKKLCPACAVFGMVGKNGENGLGSRIRFTDAILSNDGVRAGGYKTLKELGSPRTSYLPFYSTDKKNYDKDGASLRGRKFYWHNPKAASNESIYTVKEKTNRNGSFELINTGSKFSFKVYYEDLTKDQLDILAWTLTLGNNNMNCHKIGHGKPLGLGSVKIRIDEKQERVLKDGYCLKTTSYDKTHAFQLPDLIDQNAKEDLLIITDFENENLKDVDICYPCVKGDKSNNVNDTASHQWFKKYKEKSLPSISETNKKKFLPILEFTASSGSDGNTNQRGSSANMQNNYKRNPYPKKNH